MITTYTEITPLEGLQLLVDNYGKPVKSLAFKDAMAGWTRKDLIGVTVDVYCSFRTSQSESYSQCAKVTEIDPCNAPFSYAELEPWMAYVGKAPNADRILGLEYFIAYSNGRWGGGYAGDSPTKYYAIDVRTAWAQEHYPEHCKQRAYRGDIHACRRAASKLIIAGGRNELKKLLGNAANVTEYKGNLDELRAKIEAYVTPVLRGDSIACWNALLKKRASIDPSDWKKWLGGAIDLASYKGNYDELREKIEAYEPPAPEVKPDAFQVAWQKHRNAVWGVTKADLRRFYELGQRNPTDELQ